MSAGLSPSTFADRVREAIGSKPGISDREITTVLVGPDAHPSQVNQTCRMLVAKGLVRRQAGADGRIGNYLGDAPLPQPKTSPPVAIANTDTLSEDGVKEHLRVWLEAQGWSVEIAWGKQRGADLIATRGAERWIIEAKGCGSRQAMRVNYFVAVLGETLQRMTEVQARYSIALPDMNQFRGLWRRLPPLSKERTGITALFVTGDGAIEEVAE